MESVALSDGLITLTGVGYRPGFANNYGDSAEKTSLSGDFEDGMFYNCTSLKTINWGANIKTIGNVVFLNCTALTSLTLPATITDLGNHAFFGCSSLETVTVLGNVNSLGRRTFANCPSLQ